MSEQGSSKTSTLFDAIAHGDAAHRAWLKQAIDDHFAGRPVQPVRGLGRREVIAVQVVQNVCELPDYNSPDDQPDLVMCTVQELENCVLRAFEGSSDETNGRLARLETLVKQQLEMDRALGWRSDSWHEAAVLAVGEQPPALKAREPLPRTEPQSTCDNPQCAVCDGPAQNGSEHASGR